MFLRKVRSVLNLLRGLGNALHEGRRLLIWPRERDIRHGYHSANLLVVVDDRNTANLKVLHDLLDLFHR